MDGSFQIVFMIYHVIIVCNSTYIEEYCFIEANKVLYNLILQLNVSTEYYSICFRFLSAFWNRFIVCLMTDMHCFRFEIQVQIKSYE